MKKEDPIPKCKECGDEMMTGKNLPWFCPDHGDEYGEGGTLSPRIASPFAKNGDVIEIKTEFKEGESRTISIQSVPPFDILLQQFENAVKAYEQRIVPENRNVREGKRIQIITEFRSRLEREKELEAEIEEIETAGGDLQNKVEEDAELIRRAHQLICNGILSDDGIDGDDGISWMRDAELAHPEIPRPPEEDQDKEAVNPPAGSSHE